jgi:aryl-alcohol dehydrogenase-like predicted oxidoreductase
LLLADVRSLATVIENRDGERRQRNGAAAGGGLSLVDPRKADPTLAYQLAGHRDGARVGVKVAPSQRVGLPMAHLAMAFAIAHPGVTSAIIGPRTMEQLDDLLAGADTTLDDEVLDQIDQIAPPGTDAGPKRCGLYTSAAQGPEPASPIRR